MQQLRITDKTTICWFGEMPFHIDEVFIALKQCTVLVAVGTSGVVEPAASFAARAKLSGARSYYVGPEEPANKDVFEELFPGKAGEVLPSLMESI